MSISDDRVIVVTGATGLQGGAVARQLLKEGWRVKGLTRNKTGTAAKALAGIGVDVVQGDMEDMASIQPIFAGAYGLYSVQNPYIGGPESEVRQGKNVAEVATEVGIKHLVYGSAGIGEPGTGIPSWETKLRVEEHIKRVQAPYTILRPMAFMELMSEKKFFPSVAIWHVMPTLIGNTRPVAWLSVDDLGVIVARTFADPERFIGRSFSLASDVQSLERCREIHREVTGKYPARYPMPIWLFQRFGFVGRDLTTMWRWLKTATIDLDTAPTREIHPDALTVRAWLHMKKANTSAP